MTRCFHVAALALLLVACGNDPVPDGGVDAGPPPPGMDSGPGGADAGFDGGTDAGFDGGVDAGAPTGCGYDETFMEFTCGGTAGNPAEATCTGTDCCVGMCAPGAGQQLSCCDSATGIVTRGSYGGGTCQMETEDCSMM